MRRINRSGCELKSGKLRVQAALFKQFGMRALGNNAPAVKHDDTIGFLYGRQTVRDDKGRAIFHQPFECVLHETF